MRKSEIEVLKAEADISDGLMKHWQSLAHRYRALARAAKRIFRGIPDMADSDLDAAATDFCARLARLDAQAGFWRTQKGRKP